MTSSIVVDPSGGANQIRVRAYNERLVMTLIRRHGALPKAEIARRSGLSAQTASVIMRSLESDALLVRGEPQRGRVGQPSIPLGLNPDGVFSIGLKIGRRSAVLVLVDFLGAVRASSSMAYAYPLPDEILQFLKTDLPLLLENLPPKLHERIAGIGIATPFELWNWAERVGAPGKRMSEWKDFDMASEVARLTDLPVFVQNDATTACGAELVFGSGQAYRDFAYFFIGYFIGGGIVIDHAIYPGRSGNAGALGSLPIAVGNHGTGQLLDQVSLSKLEVTLLQHSIDPSPIWKTPDGWTTFGAILDQWIDDSAAHLARAALACCAVIDFQAIIIDGAFPADVRTRLVEKTNAALETMNIQGLQRPDILAGDIGNDARSLGAATLPIFNRYLIDQNVLFSGS